MNVPSQTHPPAPNRIDPVRLERDRHVAFAFAAADLLLETHPDGEIVAASGAAQAIVGRAITTLTGMNVQDLTERSDKAFIDQLLKRILQKGRIDPVHVGLVRPDGKVSAILIGGCYLPNLPKSIFLSVTVLPPGLVKANLPKDDATGLLTKDALLRVGRNAARESQPGGAQLTLLHLDGLANASRHLPPNRANLMMEEIGAALRAQSIGGDSAGRLAEDSFGYISKATGDHQPDTVLLKEIGDVFRGAGVGDGGIASIFARMPLDSEGLSDEDVIRAMAHAVNTFVKTRARDFPLLSLADGLASAVRETVVRVSETRRIIDDGDFSLVFQPVMQIATRSVHHYEALSRFSGDKTTFETIRFSEDIGLVAQLDLAVCERAITALAENPSVKIAVNLSGCSIQTDAFRRGFGELVRPLHGMRDRLMFELTESAVVEDLEEAAGFLRWLRKLGHAVCLDDFGAGAAAYSYLRRFDVDFVKIDGPFLNAAISAPRERALIRSICDLCAALDCRVIGEMIEDEKMAALAESLGIEFGQGWLFGKPMAHLPAPVVALRRKGAVESWG